MADSWEDDEGASSYSSSESDAAAELHPSSVPMAPPPTPISPSVRTGDRWGGFPSTYSFASGRSADGTQAQSPSSRPEKSAAAAGRMIAGALGVKQPMKTEEARAYENAVREKESKRISKAREERRMEEERRQHTLKQVWEG